MKINLQTIVLLSIFFLSSYTLASEPNVSVSPEMVPIILKKISIQTEENFNRIHTWQGEIEISEYSIYAGEEAKDAFETQTNAKGQYPKELSMLSKVKIVFGCDLEKGKFFSKGKRENPPIYTDSADGRDLGTNQPTINLSHILTNEYYISSGPSLRNRQTKEIIKRRAIKKKFEKDNSYLNSDEFYVYDPRDMFDFKSPPWRSYSGLAQVIENKGEYVNQKGEFENDGYTLKIEENKLPNDIEYTIYLPAKMCVPDYNGLTWMIRKHSENAGYNMISYIVKRADGPILRQRNFEYQKINGIFIPVKCVYEYFDTINFTLKRRQEQVFENVRINENISEDKFSEKNLGLKNGDRFIDKIAGKEYKYEDSNLIFLKDLPEQATEKMKTDVNEPNNQPK